MIDQNNIHKKIIYKNTNSKNSQWALAHLDSTQVGLYKRSITVVNLPWIVYNLPNKTCYEVKKRIKLLFWSSPGLINMEDFKGKSIMPESKPFTSSNGYRVLLVEYNRTCQFIMETMLRSCGYQGTLHYYYNYNYDFLLILFVLFP